MIDAPSSADLYRRWEEGDIDERGPLQALYSDLRAVEEHLKRLEGRRTFLRGRIAQIVQAQGGKYTLDHVGEFRMLDPYHVVSYDAKGLDALVLALLDEGDIGNVQRLRALRTERTQGGALRIQPIKPLKS